MVNVWFVLITSFIFGPVRYTSDLIEIPTLRSVEDAAEGIWGATEVSHWCTGCEWSRRFLLFYTRWQSDLSWKERACGRVHSNDPARWQMCGEMMWASVCVRKQAAPTAENGKQEENGEVGKRIIEQVYSSIKKTLSQQKKYCMFRRNASCGATFTIYSLIPWELTCACLCASSWSSSDTCWSPSGSSTTSARVFCACE